MGCRVCIRSALRGECGGNIASVCPSQAALHLLLIGARLLLVRAVLRASSSTGLTGGLACMFLVSTSSMEQ